MKIISFASRKTATVLICGFLAAALMVVLFVSASADSKSIDASDSEKRVKFLASIGVSADKNSEKVKYVTVPTKFNKVYENYNGLQKSAGYDLSLYKGALAKLYSYEVIKNGEIKYYANLLTYNGRIIGGDVCSPELDGQMLPLCKEEIKRCLR